MSTIVWRVLLLLCVGFLAGCPPPVDPYYDDDIGLEGTAVDPGALAGTFALKMQVTTQTDLPVIGTVTGGGDTYLLISRTYDAASQSYAQSNQVCGGLIRSETSESTLPDESWQSITPQTPRTVTIRDADGFFEVDHHLELWGLENLENPYTDALPEDHLAAQEPPHASRIVDMDNDGHPGMTITVNGLVSGDFYFVQRKISDLHGVLQGPDRAVGLHTSSFEQTILGASDAPVQQGYPQRQHPDPKQSWFEELRVDDASTCDTVLDMVADETLSRFRPF
jgi:hypothetical protein